MKEKRRQITRTQTPYGDRYKKKKRKLRKFRLTAVEQVHWHAVYTIWQLYRPQKIISSANGMFFHAFFFNIILYKMPTTSAYH